MNSNRILSTIYMLLVGIVMTFAQGSNVLRVPDVIIPTGNSNELSVELENSADVVAVEFTLTLPSKVTIESSGALTLSERCDGHASKYSHLGNNKYKVMVYSPDNKPFIGNAGELLTLKVKADQTLADGTVLPMALENVVIGKKDGSNIMTDTSVGVVKIMKPCDLEVTNIGVGATEFVPGEKCKVTWTVKNIGGKATESGWREEVYLYTTDAASQTRKVATIYNNDILAIGGTMNREVEFTLDNVVGLDGNVGVKVKLTPNSDCGEPNTTIFRQNNESVLNGVVNVKTKLTLSPTDKSVAEGRNPSWTYMLTRSGRNNFDETFTLAATEDSRVKLPETVTILKGYSGASFTAAVEPNQKLDAIMTVDIAYGNDKYGNASAKLNIEDDTDPTLTITSEQQEVKEDGTIKLKIATNRLTATDVKVTLGCDMPTRFKIPSGIVIPSGETEVEVTVEAIDNETPDIEQVVKFSASAEKHVAGSLLTTLVDNDMPTLKLELTPSAVAEDAGLLAVTAKISRTDNIDKKVTIKLSDDSDGGIYYSSQSVDLAAGVSEKTISLGPVDNTIVDGEREVNITAAVYVSACSCNASNGTYGGVVTSKLTIYDNDGPTLSFNKSSSVLKEGDEMNITIKRNSTSAQALTITLSTDHPNELEIPSTVTIESGKSETTFTVKSIANETQGDDFAAQITAEASGYSKTIISFNVTDQSLADAQLTAISASTSQIEAGGRVTMTVELANTGNYPIPEMTTVSVHHGDETTLMYLQEELEAGKTVRLTKEIVMPNAVGTFDVYAVANENKNAEELSYTNNTSDVVKITTTTPFSASVSVGKTVYSEEEEFEITGQLQGASIANRNVEVYVINEGVRNVVNVVSDENGTFKAAYTPIKGQMGHFAIGACFASENMNTEMAGVDVYGLRRTDSEYIKCETLVGDAYNGKISIVNPSVLSLTGMEVSVTSKPDNCTVTVNCPQSLDGGKTGDVTFTINPTAASQGTDWDKITLSVKTVEGAVLPLTIYNYSRVKTATLKASIATIETTMTKGSMREYPFDITNIGNGETGKITLDLPSWMSTSSPREIASVAGGETTNVVLTFTPTDDMALNIPVTGVIGVNCENGVGFALPFSIEPVSDNKGTLIVDVCDEYTYNTAEQPHLANATVKVLHPATGAEIATGVTDANGLFKVDIPEGIYRVDVDADKHDSYRNEKVVVAPALDNKLTVNLSCQPIVVKWDVKETTVEDVYNITTTMEFETSVPVPQVKLEMPSYVPANLLGVGESLIFYASLTNVGLITAEDVQFVLPMGFNSLIFEQMSYTEPFDLAPQQNVMIPVKVTRIGSPTQAKGLLKAVPIDDDPCVGQPGTLYYWDCGLDRKWHRYGVALQLGTCNSNDKNTWGGSGSGGAGGAGGSGGGGGFIGWGGLGGPSGSGTSSPYFSSDSNQSVPASNVTEDCEPCQNKFMLTLGDCGLELIPAYRKFKGVLGCITSVWEFMKTATGKNPKPREIAFGAASAVSSCASAISGLGTNNSTAVEELIDEIMATLDEITIRLGQSKPDDTIGDVFDFEFLLDRLGALSAKLLSLTGLDGDVYERVFCPLKLLQPCDLEGSPAGAKSLNGKVMRSTAMSDYVYDFQKSLSLPLTCDLSVIGIRKEIFNDVSWLSSDEDQLNVFIETLDGAMDDNGVVSDENIEAVVANRPENISATIARNFIARWNATMNGEEGGFDLNKVQEYFNVIDNSGKQIQYMGYESVADLYESAYKKAISDMKKESTVCSSITLQLSQQMVMTRQAFRGTLSIFNGHESLPMTDVKLNLNILDEDGNVASSSEFQINPESLEGFDGKLDLTSGWSLKAQKDGVATVLFIPTKNAAPVTPKVYNFGGSVTYLDPFTNLEVTRVLMPVPLTVNPSPILDLTYFVQRDMIGDDPLTPKVEPSQDAEFALLINNVGYGDATDVRMITQQPEIISNDKGLLIDFEIVSSQLNGGEKALAMGSSITTEFGDIPAKKQAYAQWWLRSSLLGHFNDYKVEATHVSSYDNPDLSLLNEVTVHELIRSVVVGDEADNKLGFLANDIKSDDIPDRIYMTDGTNAVVNPAVNAAMTKLGDREYEITVTPTTAGWNYGSIIDPTYGVSKIESITKNGKPISLRNFWLTDRTLVDGEDPIYENRIHFADDFDSAETVTYVVTFANAPKLPIKIVQVEGVPTMITQTPVESLNVVFNQVVDKDSFTCDDLTLCVQGEKQTVDIPISTEDGKTYTLDFTELNKTAGNGYYTLTIRIDGISDLEGNPGVDGKTVSWTLFKDGLVKFLTTTYPMYSGTVERTYVTVLANAKAKVAAAAEVEENTATYGQKVKLTQTASEGYEFKNWTQDGNVLSDEPELIVSAISDISITANFVKKQYQIDVEAEEGGSVEGSLTGIYSHGDELTMKAVAGDEFKFVGWIVDGRDAGSAETLTLTVEKAMSVKAMFERSVFEQKVTAPTGWTWVSTYVQEPLPVSSLPYLTRIVSQFDENILDPEYGMTGTIESIMPGLGYKFNAYASFLKSLKGNLYDTEATPISLKPGYNWIAYPYFEELLLSSVIVNASEGDAIRSLGGGYAHYSEGAWIGNLEKLTPGQGYIYKSVDAKNLELDFSASISTHAKAYGSDEQVQPTTAMVDVHKYPNTMDVTAKLFADGNELVGDDYVVYAMAGSECRGVSKLVDGRHFLTVHGDDAVNITFIVENGFTGDSFIADKTMTFVDGMVGTYSAPYSITVRGTTGMERVFAGGRKLPIYTVEGILVAPEATLETLKKLPSGVYLIDGAKYVVE